MKFEREAEALLRDLIAIHSPYFHEAEALEFVHKWLEKNGVENELMHYEESEITGFKGVNVHGRIKGGGGGPNILLNGHMDTVNICEGWRTNPLEAVIRDGMMYGLGSLDMKSGVTALLLALLELNRNREQLKGDILFAFVSDEEGPFGLGTNMLIDTGKLDDADLSIVTEPSAAFTKNPFPCLCLGARGGYNYTVNFFGKSAHAANPDEGVNAASDAAKVMTMLEKMSPAYEPLLGRGSICIVDVKGGHDVCSVPDKASFTVFRHIVRGETKETVIEEVETAIRMANIKSDYEVVVRKAPSEAYEGFMPYTVDLDNLYTMSFMESVQEVTGKEPSIGYFSSIGDFNFIASRLGVPTFVFGPDGANYHTANEHVKLETVSQTTEILLNYIYRLNQ